MIVATWRVFAIALLHVLWIAGDVPNFAMIASWAGEFLARGLLPGVCRSSVFRSFSRLSTQLSLFVFELFAVAFDTVSVYFLRA